MKTRQQHDLEVDAIRQKLKNLSFNKSTLNKKTVSNTLRSHNLGSIRKTIGIDRLNAVLEIDTMNQSALVEPSVPMDQLAEECLKFNFLVPVMPEFKGITVGGAINGAGIESSSFQLGQFNDICLSYEILLGNGDLIHVSKDEHPDLFYGVAGAYGSLGFITAVKIKLIPFKPWVLLNYHHFESTVEAINHLKQLANQQTVPDFLEAIVFSSTKTILIEGSLKSENEVKNVPDILSLSLFKPWYYEHVKTTTHKTEKIPTKKYLFRHDQGAFWMGAYAAHSKLLLRYYMDIRLYLKALGESILPLAPLKKNFKLKSPGRLFWLTFSWWMSSRKLYRMLHRGAEEWFKDHFIIQDYYIPFNKVEDFVDYSIKKTGIFPIWLCPVKGTKTPQIFSPHYKKEEEEVELFIDVGIYGFPNKEEPLPSLNRALDQYTKECNGRKMLYSFNYFTENEFFEIYNKEEYLALRQKYKADTLPHIHEKILTL